MRWCGLNCCHTPIGSSYAVDAAKRLTRCMTGRNAGSRIFPCLTPQWSCWSIAADLNCPKGYLAKGAVWGYIDQTGKVVCTFTKASSRSWRRCSFRATVAQRDEWMSGAPITKHQRRTKFQFPRKFQALPAWAMRCAKWNCCVGSGSMEIWIAREEALWRRTPNAGLNAKVVPAQPGTVQSIPGARMVQRCQSD